MGVRSTGPSDANVMLAGRVVVTTNGVYRPPMYRAEAAAFVLALLLLATMLAVHTASIASTATGLAAVVIVALARLRAYRAHGPLGPPMLALRENTLVFTLPQDSRRRESVPLAEYRQLIVYGAAGRRIFRFVRPDGGHTEVRPGWAVAFENGAIELLQRSLPPAVRLTVEEPQTAFASIRGDGPA